MRTRFTQVTVVKAGGPGNELNPALLLDTPDVLFAFRSHTIVRKAFIDAIPLCINFHPGPPERRGTGCVNFALIAGDHSYGCTCHHIDTEIDHGPIINVRRFPVSERDGVAEVLNRTYDYMLCQLYEVVDRIAEGKGITQADHVWSGAVGKACEMNALREITLSPEAAADLDRQVRATAFGMFQPFVVLHGRRFSLDQQQPITQSVPLSNTGTLLAPPQVEMVDSRE